MAEPEYYVLLTTAGLNAYGAAVAGGPKVEFAEFAVGDGGGGPVFPAENWSGLTGEKWRGNPTFVEADPENPRIVTVETYIPHNAGGFTVREIGLFGPDGKLLAVGSHPDSYKPTSESGAAKEMRVRLMIEHSNAERTTLKIDPTIVMASREYAEKVSKIEIAKHDADPASHGAMLAARSINTVAPLAGGGTLAGDLTLRLAAASDGDTLLFKGGAWGFGRQYDLCEFYYFRHPTLKPGFQPAQGGVLTNAATVYPEAWAYLQTADGQMLCKTEAAWQAMTTATWATLADGTKVGWNGIGGAPFYAPNMATGALRLPDLRGMYAEAAGFDALGVGAVHGDAGRNITGTIYNLHSTTPNAVSTGAFVWCGPIATGNQQIAAPNYSGGVLLDSSRVAPVAGKNQPRAWGALACVYLGLAS